MALRSRACRPCRDRRCKCDKTFPQCLQCLKTNRFCPGPVQGPIIVDMTATTAKRNKSGYGSDWKSDLSRKDLTISRSTSAPSSFPAMSELFFSHFIDFFCGKNVGSLRKPWMHQLPLAHLTPGSPLTVTLSIQAVALGYHAMRSQDRQALRRAYEIYGHALKTHRVSLATLQSSRCTETFLTVEVLRATLMLSFFETLHYSHPAAYTEHITGATTVLEMVGANKCKTGPLNQLFFSVRSQSVRPYLSASQADRRLTFLGLRLYCFT